MGTKHDELSRVRLAGTWTQSLRQIHRLNWYQRWFRVLDPPRTLARYQRWIETTKILCGQLNVQLADVSTRCSSYPRDEVLDPPKQSITLALACTDIYTIYSMQVIYSAIRSIWAAFGGSYAPDSAEPKTSLCKPFKFMELERQHS